MKIRHLLLSALLLMLVSISVSADEAKDQPAGAHRSPSSEGASVGFKSLQENDKVEFDKTAGEKGPKAEVVRLVQ